MHKEREFFGQIHRWRRQEYKVLMLCNNEGEQERLEELWDEYGFERKVASWTFFTER